MQRVPEPEVMDTWEDAIEYDAMDFTEVNTAFAQSAVAVGPSAGLILDAGTGTARIPMILAKLRPNWQIIGIDLSENMLKVGQQNIEQAGLQAQIKLEQVDAKQMPYPDHYFDAIISNSIVHHLPDPAQFFQEVKRVLKPNGGMFLRDLLRPDDDQTAQKLVETYAAECNEYQKQLFFQSFKAAFTIEELQQMIEGAGLENVNIYQSSDRHWTAERKSKL